MIGALTRTDTEQKAKQRASVTGSSAALGRIAVIQAVTAVLFAVNLLRRWQILRHDPALTSVLGLDGMAGGSLKGAFSSCQQRRHGITRLLPTTLASPHADGCRLT